MSNLLGPFVGFFGVIVENAGNWSVCKERRRNWELRARCLFRQLEAKPLPILAARDLNGHCLWVVKGLILFSSKDGVIVPKSRYSLEL